MEFSVDFDKIAEIYGEDVLEEMQKNMDEVIKNINYMYMLEFNDVEDIFEREILLFLYDHDTFKDKLNKLVYKLGLNYVEKIENDLSLLESLQ